MTRPQQETVTSRSHTKNGVFPGTEAHPQRTRIELQKITKLFNGNLSVVWKEQMGLLNLCVMCSCVQVWLLRCGDANVIGSGFQRNPIRIGYFLTGPLRFRQGTGVISSEWLFVLQENRRETTSVTSEVGRYEKFSWKLRNTVKFRVKLERWVGRDRVFLFWGLH